MFVFCFFSQTDSYSVVTHGPIQEIVVDMIHPSEICNLFLYRTKEYSTLWKLALLEILAFNIGKILLIGVYCISTMKPSSMSGKPLICIDRVCEVFRLAGFWSAQSEVAPLSPMGLLASTLRNTWQNPWPLSVWITHQQFQVSLILGTEQLGNPFTELLGIVRGKSSILLVWGSRWQNPCWAVAALSCTLGGKCWV